MHRFRWLASLSAFSLAVAFFASGCGQTPPSPERNPQPGPAKENKTPTEVKPPQPALNLGKPDFSLSSEAFAEEFKKDKNAANEKYKMKVVELTGRVRALETFETGESALALEGPPRSSQRVVCVTPDRWPSRNAMPGQIATIKGQAQESDEIPVLLKCEIVKAEGDKPPETSADELAAEYARDKQTVMKKYDDKQIVLSGVVEKVEFNEAKRASVWLKTKLQEPRVAAEFRIFSPVPETLKPGHKLEVVGRCFFLDPKREAHVAVDSLMTEPK